MLKPFLSRLMVILSLLTVCGAGYLWADCLLRQYTWTHVTGTVARHLVVDEDLFKGGIEAGAFRLSPEMMFRDAESGKTHFCQSSVSYVPAEEPPDGTLVELIYPAGNPWEAQENTFSAQYRLPLLVTLGAVAVGLLSWGLKYRRGGSPR